MHEEKKTKSIWAFPRLGTAVVGFLAVGLALTTMAPTFGLFDTSGGSTAPIPDIEGKMPCATRQTSGPITGGFWRQKTICNVGEVAMSAGGYCSGAGQMVGVSTTAGVLDRTSWLWCTGNGNAYWYAVCCPE
jgi:hypothetical protein